MSNKITDINKILENYSSEITEAIINEATAIGNQAVSKLRNNKNSYKIRSGDYNKNWSIKVEKGKNFVHATVYNKKHYRLTHLLEKGHATRNGGRTKAFPHIAPVEEFVQKTFSENVKNIVEQGGKI